MHWRPLIEQNASLFDFLSVRIDILGTICILYADFGHYIMYYIIIPLCVMHITFSRIQPGPIILIIILNTQDSGHDSTMRRRRRRLDHYFSVSSERRRPGARGPQRDSPYSLRLYSCTWRRFLHIYSTTGEAGPRDNNNNNKTTGRHIRIYLCVYVYVYNILVL